MKLFKDKAPVVEKQEEVKKSTQDLVEEIHETFFTEVDRLLKEAKIAKPVDKNVALEDYWLS